MNTRAKNRIQKSALTQAILHASIMTMDSPIPDAAQTAFRWASQIHRSPRPLLKPLAAFLNLNVRFVCCVLAGAALVIPIAAPGAVIMIPNPTSVYESSTNLISITALDLTTVKSISDGKLTVSFSDPKETKTVPTSWSTWSSPPFSETATPRVLQSLSAATTSTFSFSQPLATFGVEAEPDPFSVQVITANFFDGTTLAGTISQSVNGRSGALLFGATASGGGVFTSVTFLSSVDFGLAEFRYALAVSMPAVPPGVSALGPNPIPDSATTNVVISSLGTSGAVPIAAATTNINTLTQGFTTASTIDTSPGTLRLGVAGGIFITPGSADLTIGTAPNSGILTAGGNAANVAGALLLENDSNSLLTINSVVADNGTGVVSVTAGGAGKIILAGANTYTGATTINGGTLQIGDGVTAGATIAPSGTVQVNATGALATNLSSGSTFANAVSLNSASASLNAIQSGTNILSGVISGAGAFNQNGAGTTILTNANLYTGSTNVNAGALEVDGSLAAGSTVNVATAGTLTGTGTINGNATLTGNDIIRLGLGGNIVGTLGVNGGSWDGQGTVGGLVTSSSGTFNINGNLTARSELAVTGGTIAGNGTLTGSLNYTSGSSSVFHGVIAGADSTVTMNNPASVLTLTGKNTYTGGTFITGGLIDFNSLANFGAGPVTLNGGGLQWAPGTTADISGRLAPIGISGGVLDTNRNDVMLSSVISGAGSLTKQGAGTLTLTAANTYAGGTFIDAGTVNFNSLANFGAGPVTLNGGRLEWAAGTSTDISSRIGNIDPKGATFDTNGSDVTFGSPLSGAGGLAKTGAGSLDLSGANTYAGNTVVRQGSLYVDGSSASPSTSVLPGAFLGGHGVIGGNLTNMGIVSPGNSPGTLTVNRNFVQPASGVLKIEIAGLDPGQHDLLAIGGAATLGGTLQLVQLNGFRFSGLGQKVVFLTAAGGVNGQFATVINPFASDSMLSAAVVYSSNAVSLQTVQSSFAALVAAAIGTGSQNEMSVAAALDASASDPRNAKLISHLDNESLSDVLRDINRIAPAELTSVYQVAFSQFQVQTSNLERRLEDVRAGSNGFSSTRFSMTGNSPGSAGPLGDAGLLQGPDGESGRMAMTPSPNNRWGVFATGSGEWVNVGDTTNSRGYAVTDAGVTVGVDFKAMEHFAIGLAVGYDHTSVDLSESGRVTVNGAKLALYGTYFTGKGFYTDFAVQGGYDSYDSHRSGVDGQARSSTDGGELNVLFGTGYDFKAGALTFGPIANFRYTYVGFKSFSEDGSLAPLEFPSQHQESITSAIGAKASYDWNFGGVVVRPELRARWQHEYGENTLSINSHFANGAGPDFTVHGPEIGRDSLLLGAGFAIVWNERFSTYVYYDGELARTNYQSSNISAGLRLQF